MTDSNKLIEILDKSFAEQHEKRGLLTAQHTADDLLANGVIVPPCKVGDIVYTLCGERYFDDNGVEWERLSGKQHIEERQFSLGMMDKNYNLCSCYFLTKEEAEQKLKELNDNA